MGWMGHGNGTRRCAEARSLGGFWVSAFLVTDALLVFAFNVERPAGCGKREFDRGGPEEKGCIRVLVT